MNRGDVTSGLASAIAYIRAHLDESLDLAALATRAGFSPFHFHRVFRALVGESLGAYIRRERLQRAALALRNGKREITELALEAGYETHSAFTRAFNEHFGVTPSAFRSDESTPIVPAHALPQFQGKPMDVAVVELPPRRLLAFHQLGSYRNVGAAFAKLREIESARGFISDRTEFLGLSYDDPGSVDEDRLRFDACMTSSDERVCDPLHVLHFEGGRHALYRHVGPHHLLEHVFDRMFDAVVFSGSHTLRDAPCIEIYRNEPSAVQNAEPITDVYIPID